MLAVILAPWILKRSCTNASVKKRYISKPIDTAKLNADLERWLDKASSEETKAMQNRDVIDENQLRKLSGNIPDHVEALIATYLEQTTTDLKQIRSAIVCSAVVDIERLAHDCVTRSADHGMNAILPVFQSIESMAKEHRFTTYLANDFMEQVETEFEKIQTAALRFQKTFDRKSA